MEKDFLLYLMYYSIIGIRERCYENKDMISFELCNVLHKIPLQLINEPDVSEAYNDLIKHVEANGMHKWLEASKKSFENWSSQYKKKSR